MYIVLEMPTNAKGEGPEMDPSKVVITYYQVWDEAWNTVSEHTSLAEANAEADRLNSPV